MQAACWGSNADCFWVGELLLLASCVWIPHGVLFYTISICCGDFVGLIQKKIKVYGNGKKKDLLWNIEYRTQRQHPNPKMIRVWPSACSLHTFPHYAYLKKNQTGPTPKWTYCVCVYSESWFYHHCCCCMIVTEPGRRRTLLGQQHIAARSA